MMSSPDDLYDGADGLGASKYCGMIACYVYMLYVICTLLSGSRRIAGKQVDAVAVLTPTGT